MTDRNSSAPPPAGWRINDWCRALPCCKATFYNLRKREADLLKIVEIGSMIIIRTSPADYLAAKAAEAAEAAGEPKTANTRTRQRGKFAAAQVISPPGVGD